MSKHDQYQISLKAIVRNDQGEVLLLKARDTGSMAGYHDLPGGRISVEEYGVPFGEILAREIREEVGEVRFEILEVPVAYGRHTLRSGNVHVLYLFFVVRFEGGEVVISDEHMGHNWVKLEEVEPKEYFTSGILEGVKQYLKR